jgi:hypothetical protein
MARSLIAGHSHVKYFDQYLTLSNVDVVYFSGCGIEQMWGVIGSQVRRYRAIVLHAGGNNLWDDHPADILSKYQQLVSNIWQVNPRCQVAMSGLLPRG